MAADADSPDGEMSSTEASKQPSTEPDLSPDAGPSSIALQGADAEDYEAADARSDDLDAVEDEGAKPAKRRMSPVRLAILVGLIVVFVLGGVVGWLGFRTYHLRQDQEQRELFLRVGRQSAVNLTTIDWQNVNGDIQRILDSATGQFYDDFSKRSQPFIDVVKKVQSKSVGTVTEAGLESVSGNEARVLVAVSVKTTNLGAAEQAPRAWRMRIDVQKVDDGAKVSNVLFVPS
ncbi:MAG: Mce protein [Mycobacterium sp.]